MDRNYWLVVLFLVLAAMAASVGMMSASGILVLMGVVVIILTAWGDEPFDDD